MSKKEKYIKLDQKEENYINIYHEWYVLHWDWNDICKYHQCCKGTVSKALDWVDANKLNIPAKSLLNGAIHAIKIRLKQITEVYNTESKKQRNRSLKTLIELNKELREDEKLLYNLQNILVEKFDINMNVQSNVEILKLITDAAKKPESTIQEIK